MNYNFIFTKSFFEENNFIYSTLNSAAYFLNFPPVRTAIAFIPLGHIKGVSYKASKL